MQGESDLIAVESEEFTTIIMEGAFCTLPEESPVSGKAHLVILNPLQFTATKTAHLCSLELFYGEEPAEIVGDAEMGNCVLGTVSINGVTKFASHLP